MKRSERTDATGANHEDLGGLDLVAEVVALVD